MRVRVRLAATALLLLAACDSGKDATAAKVAEGEVLPGSVSDAMLPYDTVTSAPPLEAPGAGTDDGNAASADRPASTASDAAQEEGADVPEPDAT